MWSFIKRQRQLVADDERVARLISMRQRDMRSLTALDFAKAGTALKAPAHHIAAFYGIESSGKGTGADGRVKILFEPHVVSRVTKRALDGRDFPWQWNGRPATVHLSYPRWKPLTQRVRRSNQWHPYKESHEGQWEMLAAVYRLHREALAGASYGGFQILGENARTLGFGDGPRGSHESAVLHMLDEMYSGECAHLEIALRFLKVNNLIEPLRRGDWLTLAKGYNGSGQATWFAHKLQVEADRQKRVLVV